MLAGMYACTRAIRNAGCQVVLACYAGNVFLWDKLMAKQKQPAPIIGEFMRALPLPQPTEAATARPERLVATAAARGSRKAGPPKSRAATSAVQLLSIQRAVAAAVSAIIGAEVSFYASSNAQHLLFGMYLMSDVHRKDGLCVAFGSLWYRATGIVAFKRHRRGCSH